MDDQGSTLLAWSQDLASGAALPLLFEIRAHASTTWLSFLALLIAAGASLPFLVTYLFIPQQPKKPPHRQWQQVANAVIDLATAGAKITFNSALMFQNAKRIDEDVGAELCAIPLFGLLTLYGTSLPTYAHRGRVVLIVLTLVTFVYACFLTRTDLETEEVLQQYYPRHPYTNVTASALSVVSLLADSVFACNAESPHGSATLLFLAGRALFFILITTFHTMLYPLIDAIGSLALMCIQSTMLIQSSMLQAGTARTALDTLQPLLQPPASTAAQGPVRAQTTRNMMLVVAGALTLAYHFSWTHPEWASYTVIALTGAKYALDWLS